MKITLTYNLLSKLVYGGLVEASAGWSIYDILTISQYIFVFRYEGIFKLIFISTYIGIVCILDMIDLSFFSRKIVNFMRPKTWDKLSANIDHV